AVGKRKGRYDSDDEEEETKKKEPVSGAMDKFTAKGNGAAAGASGVAVKRTKTVLKSRTYFEGGYMKSVCEEVEVTDDEEEPLQPAKTNQTRAVPAPDTKKAKTGVENKVEGSSTAAAGGGKGAGKGAATGKGKKAAPKSAGKQASMMSFFKKA
ncbi:unnamed protein product, partial [Scytosiphon promiscuus]